MATTSHNHSSGVMAYAHFIVNHRWKVLLTTLFLSLGLGAGASLIQMNDSYRYFFKPENPQLKAFDALQNTYNKNDNILFILAPQDGNVFSKETLEATAFLTKESWQTPFSVRVDSIPNSSKSYVICFH